MAKYKFVKDFSYTSWGIAPIKKIIPSGTILNGEDANNGITISLNPNKTPSDFKNQKAIPDMPSPTILVPKDAVVSISNNKDVVTGGVISAYNSLYKSLWLIFAIAAVYVITKKDKT